MFFFILLCPFNTSTIYECLYIATAVDALRQAFYFFSETVFAVEKNVIYSPITAGVGVGVLFFVLVFMCDLFFIIHDSQSIRYFKLDELLCNLNII